MKHFDVVVLGAGSAGELVANELSVAGKSVALVEKLRVGGECAYVSCMPSKAMLRSAQVRNLIKSARLVGSVSTDVTLDSDQDAYASATSRRDEIVEHLDDSGSANNSKKSGVTLFRGQGIFKDKNTLSINAEELTWSDLVVSTGSHPTIPEISGLSEIDYWTSDEVLSSSELPNSIAIIGGGPVGCELSEIFSTFGTKTYLIQFSDRLADKEHPDVTKLLTQNLRTNGVSVLLGTQVISVETQSDGKIELTLDDASTLTVERVVIATGRTPSTSGFNLEALGFSLNNQGAIQVDDSCRAVGTSNVWAAGDVTGIAPFTHTANYQGRVVVQNVQGEKVKANYSAIPRAIYTNPPVASVGRMTESSDSEKLIFASNKISNTSRSATDGSSDGIVVLCADSKSGVLIGGSAIGPHADEWMSEIALAIRAEVPLSILDDVVHGFPTFGEVLDQPIRQLVKLCRKI